jgi:transposase
MRGRERRQDAMFSYVSMEDRIPRSHPLRGIRKLVDEILKALSPQFERMYAAVGRPSIPPEQLLRALLLQALYTVRSERQLVEQLDYNLLFRWFVGLTMDDAVWDVTVYTKNRERLLEAEVATKFFEQVLSIARTHDLVSQEHFTVDGTLLEGWAGLKSFKPKKGKKTPPPNDPGNPTVNFHGEKRTNDTHRSTTDPDTRLYRKGPGKEARLYYMGHATTENRHGLVVDCRVTLASGTAEAETAVVMVKHLKRKGFRVKTVGGDKLFDQPSVVQEIRRLGVTPHFAAKKKGGAIDKRTTRHGTYKISQIKRKLIEQVYGWGKTIGLLRKLHHRGRERVAWVYRFTMAACNLLRISKLLAPT